MDAELVVRPDGDIFTCIPSTLVALRNRYEALYAYFYRQREAGGPSTRDLREVMTRERFLAAMNDEEIQERTLQKLLIDLACKEDLGLGGAAGGDLDWLRDRLSSVLLGPSPEIE